MSVKPSRSLSAAADSVREFCHDTQRVDDGWQYPMNTYDALGALSRLAGMLPQALEQSVLPVLNTHAHGRILVDGGGDADQAVRYLQEALQKAVRAASDLSEAVSRMHNESSPMGLDTQGLPEFQDDED